MPARPGGSTHLRDLGVDRDRADAGGRRSPGRRNWGYDGVDLFAPSHALRHARRPAARSSTRRTGAASAVILDVVYNHLGPDGDYLPAFSRHVLHRPAPHALGRRASTSTARTASWCARSSSTTRCTGFTSTTSTACGSTRPMRCVDDGRRAFPRRAVTPACATRRRRGRSCLIAEDERNLATLVRPTAAGGYGLDGVWADDFHHHVRARPGRRRRGLLRRLHRQRRRPRDDAPPGLVLHRPASRRTGEAARHRSVGGRAARGSSSASRTTTRSATARSASGCITRSIAAAYRAASALLLLAPETPLLFMGQEWAATTPFLFFTDHEPELGAAVTDGRRRGVRRLLRVRRPGGAQPDSRSAGASRPSRRAGWSGSETSVERRTPPSSACTARCSRCGVRCVAAIRPQPSRSRLSTIAPSRSRAARTSLSSG